MKVIEVVPEGPKFHRKVYGVNMRSVYAVCKVLSPLHPNEAFVYKGFTAEIEHLLHEVYRNTPYIRIRTVYQPKTGLKLTNTFVENADRVYITDPEQGMYSKRLDRWYRKPIRKYRILNYDSRKYLELRKLPNKWIPEFDFILRGYGESDKIKPMVESEHGF